MLPSNIFFLNLLLDIFYKPAIFLHFWFFQNIIINFYDKHVGNLIYAQKHFFIKQFTSAQRRNV